MENAPLISRLSGTLRSTKSNVSWLSEAGQRLATNAHNSYAIWPVSLETSSLRTRTGSVLHDHWQRMTSEFCYRSWLDHAEWNTSDRSGFDASLRVLKYGHIITSYGYVVHREGERKRVCVRARWNLVLDDNQPTMCVDIEWLWGGECVHEESGATTGKSVGTSRLHAVGFRRIAPIQFRRVGVRAVSTTSPMSTSRRGARFPFGFASFFPIDTTLASRRVRNSRHTPPSFFISFSFFSPLLALFLALFLLYRLFLFRPSTSSLRSFSSISNRVTNIRICHRKDHLASSTSCFRANAWIERRRTWNKLAKSARGKCSRKRAANALTDLVILRPHVVQLVISPLLLFLSVFFLAHAVINRIDLSVSSWIFVSSPSHRIIYSLVI